MILVLQRTSERETNDVIRHKCFQTLHLSTSNASRVVSQCESGSACGGGELRREHLGFFLSSYGID